MRRSNDIAVAAWSGSGLQIAAVGKPYCSRRAAASALFWLFQFLDQRFEEPRCLASGDRTVVKCQ